MSLHGERGARQAAGMDHAQGARHGGDDPLHRLAGATARGGRRTDVAVSDLCLLPHLLPALPPRPPRPPPPPSRPQAPPSPPASPPPQLRPLRAPTRFSVVPSDRSRR